MDYAALAQGIMSAVGMLLEQGERQKAQMLLDAARKRFENIQLPTLDQLSQQLPASALEGVQPDAQALGAQRDTLRQALEIGKTGFGAADEAALTETGNQVAQQAKNQRAGIESSMAQRGGIGSGADYALQSAAADSAATNLGQNQKSIQAAALQRRMQGIQAASGMAGQLEGQQYGQDARLAAARDAIASENANYRRQAAETNFNNQLTQGRAIAGATNTSTAQNLANGAWLNQQLGNIGANAYGTARAAGANAQGGGTAAGSTGDWTNYGGSNPDEWAQWPGSGG